MFCVCAVGFFPIRYAHMQIVEDNDEKSSSSRQWDKCGGGDGGFDKRISSESVYV